jgi:hypothetical protein
MLIIVILLSIGMYLKLGMLRAAAVAAAAVVVG